MGQTQSQSQPYPIMPTGHYQSPQTDGQTPMNSYTPLKQYAPFETYADPSVPPGLEILLTLNQLIIEQQVEMFEVLAGFETNNSYIVKNIDGQQLYYATEENDCCTRNCFSKYRPFVMRLYDSRRNEIIRLDRPWRCNSCLFPCCLQKLDVYSGEYKLGSVRQEWTVCCPAFSILNATGKKVLRIKGPFLTFSCCCGNVKFNVVSNDGTTQVGKISKQWSGLVREMFTDADHFGVKFPRDLDVSIKAVLLGATFLIDFMFFEKVHNDKEDSLGTY
uniref:Phospholipid scramblase n=1 Tax=Dermatophagoides pteronyssinus TaxID=6956 RepID=A0A6P6Y994_DERPT|nr:phospholipid scramblase 1-like isoform X1 [Dermatophagoides pteronyssinus]